MTPDQINAYNRTISLIFNIQSVTSNWVQYLIDRKLDDEPALRNKIFCILICALTDATEGYRPRINGLKVEANRFGSKSCVFYLDVFSGLIDFLVELLALFSREDMILIASSRDEWVHGHLTEIHKSKRTIRYIDRGNLKREKIFKEEFDAVIRERIQRYGGEPNFDQAIYPLRARFCAFKTIYWILDRSLSTRLAHIEADLALHDRFVSSSFIKNDFPKVTERDRIASHPMFHSLNDIAKVAQIEPSTLDPIAPSRM